MTKVMDWADRVTIWTECVIIWSDWVIICAEYVIICGNFVIKPHLFRTFLYLCARFAWCKTEEANFWHQTCPTFEGNCVHFTVPSTCVFREEYSGRYLSIIELFFILFLHVHAEIVGERGVGERHTPAQRNIITSLICFAISVEWDTAGRSICYWQRRLIKVPRYE